MTGAFLSVRPRFSQAILSGDKRVELRRRPPDCSPGDLVVVYETSPTKAIVAIATVTSVTRQSPEALWRSVGGWTAVTRSEFSEYFAGSPTAAGIHLSHVRVLPQPIPLSAAREIAPVFRPPQSWCYLSSLPAALIAHLEALA